MCAVVVLLAGCATTSVGATSSSSPRSSTGASAPSSVASVSPTPRPTTPQEKALAAYRAMWADWITAARTSDSTTKALGREATGDALLLLLNSLAKDKHDGIVSRGQPAISPRVQSVTPATAPTHVTITDCADDSHWLKYRASTGALKDNVPGGRHYVTALVQNVGGTWMVVQFLVRPVGSC